MVNTEFRWLINSLDIQDSVPCRTQHFLSGHDYIKSVWPTQFNVQMTLEACSCGQNGRNANLFTYSLQHVNSAPPTHRKLYSELRRTLIVSLPFSVIENAVCVVRIETSRLPPDVSSNKLLLIGQQWSQVVEFIRLLCWPFIGLASVRCALDEVSISSFAISEARNSP